MKHVFNRYNLLLLGIYFILCLQISSGSSTTFIQNAGELSFEMVLLLGWGAAFSFERNRKKISSFRYDLYVTTYVFIISILIGLIFENKSVDTYGWWSVFVVVGSVFGFFWSLIYAGFAVLLRKHERYTMYYSLLLMTVLILFLVVSSYKHISDKYLYYSLAGLLMTHISTCLFARGIEYKSKH